MLREKLTSTLFPMFTLPPPRRFPTPGRFPPAKPPTGFPGRPEIGGLAIGLPVLGRVLLGLPATGLPVTGLPVPGRVVGRPSKPTAGFAYLRSPGFTEGLVDGLEGRVFGRVDGRVLGLVIGCEGRVEGRALGLNAGCDGRILGLVAGLVVGRVAGLEDGRELGRVDCLEAGFALEPVMGVRWLLALRDGLDAELRPPLLRLATPRPPARASKIGIATSVEAIRHANCLLQIFLKLSFILFISIEGLKMVWVVFSLA